ncbi:MAG: 4-phosphoerythronate dehydrogenase [Gammaproteobacteria bacterium]|nr:4-phosphoerythronate dehydrogenase [Gammaproteobacteria bacterium]
MKILADASLPHLKALFKAPFKLTTYQNEQVLHENLPHQDILLCRSTLKVTPELLQNTKLTCVATASSGIDHINTNYLKSQNIHCFDAKGSNAEAVADYVLATLSYLKTQNKIPGLRAGVMGAGEVGSRVIKRLKTLGFEVFAYDPLKPDFESCHFEALTRCDIICIHANLHDTKPHPTKNALSAPFFEKLKPNTVIINAARGGIVNEQALLNTQKNIVYCADVYQNEPYINPDIVSYATLCTPHIAGHSIEAKQDAVIYISHALHTHFGLNPVTFDLNPVIASDNTVIASEARQSKNASTISLTPSILTLYNPLLETQKLKQAGDKTSTFLTLRRQHQHRHHLSQYPSYSDI